MRAHCLPDRDDPADQVALDHLFMPGEGSVYQTACGDVFTWMQVVSLKTSERAAGLYTPGHLIQEKI